MNFELNPEYSRIEWATGILSYVGGTNEEKEGARWPQGISHANDVESRWDNGGRRSPDTPTLNQVGMSLKEKLQEVKVFDSEILALVKDEEVESEIAQDDLFKELIYSTLIQIEKASAPTPPFATVTEPNIVASAPAHSHKVRLPKLTTYSMDPILGFFQFCHSLKFRPVQG